MFMEMRFKKIKMSDTRKCPNFGRCGGCNIIDKPYAKQLELKRNYVNEQLRGYAKIDMVYGMDKPFHYRNKVHAVVSREKVTGKQNKAFVKQDNSNSHNKYGNRYDSRYDRGYDNRKGVRGEIVAGIYEEESHRVVPVEDCLLHDTYADEIIKSIVDIMKKGKFEPFDEDRGTGCIRHILIRRGHITNETMVVVVTGTKVFPGNKNFIKELLKRHPDVTTIVHNVNDKNTSMVLGQNQKTLYGKGYIEDVLCGLRFRISPKSFYQVNSVQTELLYEKAIEFAGLKGNETVIDAYCGIGTISMVAAKAAGKVIGVELNRDAVRDAKINAKINDIRNVEFYNDDAGKFMERTAEKIDTVFIDPPRSGSDEKFLGSLIRLRPEKIVYVSCNVETQRRDLGVLSKGGYKVEKACGVDLFPGTKHCEVCCLLSK